MIEYFTLLIHQNFQLNNFNINNYKYLKTTFRGDSFNKITKETISIQHIDKINISTDKNRNNCFAQYSTRFFIIFFSFFTLQYRLIITVISISFLDLLRIVLYYINIIFRVFLACFLMKKKQKKFVYRVVFFFLQYLCWLNTTLDGLYVFRRTFFHLRACFCFIFFIVTLFVLFYCFYY